MPRMVTKKDKEVQAVFNPEVAVSAPVSEEVSASEVIEPVQADKVKLYNIKPRVNHSCVIGGERYNLVKDEVVRVPNDVKRILSNAGLLTNL